MSRFSRTARWMAAGLGALSLITAAVPAYADEVKIQDLDSAGNTTIASGGSTTLTFWVLAQHEASETGQPDCNAPVTVTFTVPTGVTVDPASVTLTGCGVQSGKTATFTSSTTGEHTIVADANDVQTTDKSFTLTVTGSSNTAPTVTVPADMTVEGNTTGGAIVTFVATATDTEDGAITPVCSPASGSLFPLGTTTVSCTATDSGSLSDTETFDVTVVDTTAPTLVGMPADVSVFATSATGAVVTYTDPTATDVVDDDVDVVCSPASGSSFGLGTTTVTCTATDDSGNSDSATFNVSVRFDIRGFFQPVDNKARNTMKAGSTVPFKWQISDGSGGWISSLSVVSSVRQVKTACDSVAVEDAVEATTTGGTTLRYDTTADQYVYNWQSPKAAGSCYKVTVSFADGTALAADFRLK